MAEFVGFVEDRECSEAMKGDDMNDLEYSLQNFKYQG